MNPPVNGPMDYFFPHHAARLAPVLSLIGLCLAGAPSTPSLAGPPVERATAAGQIVYGAGRLTVDLNQASLRQVLTTVARRAGFQLTIRGDRKPLVSTSFTGLAVNDGLRRLLGRHNWVGRYQPSEDRGRAGAIAELLVILRTDGNQVYRARPLPRVVVHPVGKVAAGPSTRDDGQPGSPSQAGAFAKEAARFAASLSADLYGEEAPAQAPEPPSREERLRAERAESIARVVMRLGGVAAPDDLGGVLLYESDPGLRLAAVRALHELRTLEARRTIEIGLSDPDAGIRGATRVALDAWR